MMGNGTAYPPHNGSQFDVSYTRSSSVNFKVTPSDFLTSNDIMTVGSYTRIAINLSSDMYKALTNTANEQRNISYKLVSGFYCEFFK